MCPASTVHAFMIAKKLDGVLKAPRNSSENFEKSLKPVLIKISRETSKASRDVLGVIQSAAVRNG
jgi:hypothetical protein